MSEQSPDSSLSAAAQDILRVARENPDFSIAGIAEATGHRVPLVRDTLAAHDAELATAESDSTTTANPTDAASFNETESAVLETALRNPEATNAEIAATVDTHVGIVRDIREQYEDEVRLPDDTQHTEATGDSAGGRTTAESDLSAAQEDILAVADEQPEATNAEIAEQTGSRLPLVRDTLAAYGDELTVEQGQPADGPTPVDSASFNETESAVLTAALQNPEATNAEIATSVGAHVGLVRDIREQYEDTATLPDAADEPTESAASDQSAGGMEFDTELLSAAQEAILDVAREQPDLTNAEIAEQTDNRVPLVRDTLADHGDTRGGGQVSGAIQPTDAASFNETEAAVLEAALQNPEATNADIADRVGVHVGLVRDIREQYEDEATLAENAGESAAESDSTADNDLGIDTADLSSTQQEILETAAAQPEHTYAEIADEVDARLPLVRDTLTEHGDDIDSTAPVDTADTTASSGGSDDPAVDSELERQIIELAEANPEMTNAEIAAETGARVALVRDTREEHDITLAA